MIILTKATSIYTNPQIIKNKIMHLSKNILLAFLTISSFSIMAQPDLDSKDVEVIKDFEANLAETDKLNLNPTLAKVDTTAQRLMYQIPNRNLNVSYLPPKIRPIAIKGAKVQEKYNGYAKLGYGIPNLIYGEGAYHLIEAESYNVGLHLKHLSANNKDIAHQRFMENYAALDGTYHFSEGLAADGTISFFNDQVHFYGYDHAVDTFTKEQVRQRFNTLDLIGKVYNGKQTDEDINYEAAFNIYTFSDNFASRENAFLLNLNGSKWFAEKHLLDINVKGDFTTFKGDTDISNNIFSIAPKFTFHAEKFKFGLGANVVLHEEEFQVFPDIDATVNILGKKLTAFAGWTGDIQKNTFRSLTDYNPFLVSQPQFQNSNYQKYYGGISGTVQFVEYELQLGNKSVDGLPLYLNDLTDPKRFQVLYDTANIFYVSGLAGFDLTKDLTLNLSMTINKFDLENEKRPWHIPTTEFNVAATYKTLKDKLFLKAECYVSDAVYFKNAMGDAEQLNSLLDLSIGAEYFFTKNIGVFADINNFASNRRVRWNGYPNYGLNLYGGVSAKF